MKAHPHQKAEACHKVEIFLRRKFSRQDKDVAAVFHLAKDCVRNFPVGRELKRDEKNLRPKGGLESIGGTGKFRDEAVLPFPVPQGKANDGPLGIDAHAAQDDFPHLTIAVRKGEDSVTCDKDVLSFKAHLTKVIQGSIITDRNQIGMAADEPGQETGKTAPDRTDSLGKEHDLFPHDDAKGDDGKVIKETEMARYVLEQAASAR